MSVAGHSRPNLAVRVMSGLRPVATVGADIPVRQLRATTEVGIKNPRTQLVTLGVQRAAAHLKRCSISLRRLNTGFSPRR
jgi:hypothetical protein